MTLADWSNILSFRSQSKLCLFLVDDYGHMGMNATISQDSWHGCPGVRKADRFNQFDSLESPDDLHALFEVLQEYQGGDGSPVVFTPVVSTGNPDMQLISKDAYAWESFDKTLLKAYGPVILELWKQGEDAGIFNAELHGREHLHPGWMTEQLRAGNRSATWMRESNSVPVLEGRNEQLKPFMRQSDEDEQLQKVMLKDAVNTFESFFNRRPALFVPPGLVHGKFTETTVQNLGIPMMDAARSGNRSDAAGKVKKKLAWTGKRSGKLTYLCRNVMFEPGRDGQAAITKALSSVDTAFRWKVPAVISSHRVNFTGSRNEKNRQHGLQALRQLLSGLTSRHPDVKFVSVSELQNEMTL